MKNLVRENMSSHIITIGWNERIETAFKRMQQNNVRHLPVLTESGEIIGMLSDRDVQRAMVSSIENELMERGISETIVFDPETRVRDYMGWPVKTVDQHTELSLVAERMIHEKISSFLVSHGDNIVGIVTTEDLLKTLIHLLAPLKGKSQWTLKHILEKTFSQLESTLV